MKAILEATARILGRDGIAKLSTNRIAEVAGISVGSLYQFFRNKDSILTELLGDSIEKNFRNLLNSVERSSGGEIRPFIAGVLDAVFDNFERRGDIQRALIEQAPQMIGIERIKSFDARLAPVLIKHLEESGMRIRPNDLESAIFVLLQAIRGVVVVAFMQKKTPAEIARLKSELIELCVKYLEPDA